MTYFEKKNDVYTIFMFAERQVHGNIFANMTREDIPTIFPPPEKFVMGMQKLLVCCHTPFLMQGDDEKVFNSAYQGYHILLSF